ncbi:unnamed protein product [Spodoptera littoralis]|uniref:Uncharacterized protein n=1 Tax=Spodoptera littoralis TaxID=7109 RepID=A0A9P0HVT1_SPOLI|nr:unnamed protein product [Spodoptera littoralis]CAH1635422.1 unnamed protein product [Spodoptera littoralis]
MTAVAKFVVSHDATRASLSRAPALVHTKVSKVHNTSPSQVSLGCRSALRSVSKCALRALGPPSLLACAFRPIPPHILVPLFQATAAFLHVGTLTGALTRIVHPRRRALLGRQRAAAARHVLHDGVRGARLPVGLGVVYSYGNMSDDGLGGDAGAFVLVLAEADTALDPHRAGTDLFMCSLHLQVLEDLLGVSTLGLFNDVAALALISTRARDFLRHGYDIILSTPGELGVVFVSSHHHEQH